MLHFDKNIKLQINVTLLAFEKLFGNDFDSCALSGKEKNTLYDFWNVKVVTVLVYIKSYCDKSIYSFSGIYQYLQKLSSAILYGKV